MKVFEFTLRKKKDNDSTFLPRKKKQFFEIQHYAQAVKMSLPYDKTYNCHMTQDVTAMASHMPQKRTFLQPP